MKYQPCHVFRRSRAVYFTLVELLVVIAIIAMLAGLILPALGGARSQAKAKLCMGNLRNSGVAMEVYRADHNDGIVPSYNLDGHYSATQITLDGWGPILIMGDYLKSSCDQPGKSVLYCPETLDLDGWAGGQTGTDPNKPRGYMSWPNFNKVGTAMPGVFERVIRVSYWINAQNPIATSAPGGPSTGSGTGAPPVECPYYTTSVGYGPYSDGVSLPPQSGKNFKSPGRLIALTDGMYAGQQSNCRVGNTNRRIGYRHPGGPNQSTNALIADGHVISLTNERFPRAGTYGSSSVSDAIKKENAQVTTYANPAEYGVE